jgi:nitrogen fixation NifU-like protein
MDHYRYPRGRKKIADADVRNEGQNPVCGDEIELSLKIDDGMVADVAVECMGCAISVASGSMLAETIKGKSLEDVKQIAVAVKSILTGEPMPDSIKVGDLEALAGVKNFPVRIKCALLSWTTLVEGLEALEKGNEIKVTSTE